MMAKPHRPRRRRPRPMPILTDQTTEWARKAASGKIVVGEFVKMAAERHLRDMKTGKDRGLHWDVAAAERAINFFPSVLSITEGARSGSRSICCRGMSSSSDPSTGGRTATGFGGFASSGWKQEKVRPSLR